MISVTSNCWESSGRPKETVAGLTRTSAAAWAANPANRIGSSSEAGFMGKVGQEAGRKPSTSIYVSTEREASSKPVSEVITDHIRSGIRSEILRPARPQPLTPYGLVFTNPPTAAADREHRTL